MTDPAGLSDCLSMLLGEAARLHHRLELAATVGPDWYEPGMMEYLDQSDGLWEEEERRLLLRFEAKGTRYGGRTEAIERVSVGDPLRLLRQPDNPYDPNCILLLTESGQDVGTVPAELSQALAPLYDSGALKEVLVLASFVEPISKRCRHARQGILFAELHCVIDGLPDTGSRG